MKKIVLILTVILSTSMASQAFIDNMYMTTDQYLTNTGYSAGMAKMLTVVNQDPYRPMQMDKDKHSFKDISRKVYNYIAPTMYTDYDFYDHEIKNNTTDWRDY